MFSPFQHYSNMHLFKCIYFLDYSKAMVTRGLAEVKNLVPRFLLSFEEVVFNYEENVILIRTYTRCTNWYTLFIGILEVLSGRYLSKH